MVFCNKCYGMKYIQKVHVTILILIDGFLQFKVLNSRHLPYTCHNPYFNRWFSAINIPIFVEVNGQLSQSLF